MLSTRKRKDVQLAEVTVKVILFGFDILYLDGEVTPSNSQAKQQSLLQQSFQERRKLLHENFVQVKGEFAFAKNMDATSIEEIQAFLEDSVRDSCEGLMVKMLTGEGSSYEPSKRSMNWLKVFPTLKIAALTIDQERLFSWSRGFSRLSRRRGLPRKRKTHFSIRSLPPCLLRPSNPRIPNDL